jgi:hypothetical protein
VIRAAICYGDGVVYVPGTPSTVSAVVIEAELLAAEVTLAASAVEDRAATLFADSFSAGHCLMG